MSLCVIYCLHILWGALVDVFTDISSYLKNQIIGLRYRTNKNQKRDGSPPSGVIIATDAAMKQNHYRKRKHTFNVISPKLKPVDGVISLNNTKKGVLHTAAIGLKHRLVYNIIITIITTTTTYYLLLNRRAVMNRRASSSSSSCSPSSDVDDDDDEDEFENSREELSSINEHSKIMMHDNKNQYSPPVAVNTKASSSSSSSVQRTRKRLYVSPTLHLLGYKLIFLTSCVFSVFFISR